MTEITPAALDQLEKMLKAATPGPWVPESVLDTAVPGQRVQPWAGFTEADSELVTVAVNALPALLAAARSRMTDDGAATECGGDGCAGCAYCRWSGDDTPPETVTP